VSNSHGVGLYLWEGGLDRIIENKDSNNFLVQL
jgi:hypothetical protein